MNFPPIDHNFIENRNTEPIKLDTVFHDARGNEPIEKEVPPLMLIEQKYPRIHKQIVFLWGTQELQDRFTRWVFTDQEGRSGWPKDVYRALFALSNHHAAKFGLEGRPVFNGPRDRW